MVRAIALVAFVFQLVEEPIVPNAGLVTVYGINTPAQVEVREADSIEVPITVMQFDGAPSDGYRSVQASIRYDSARLQFVSAPPVMAGTLSKPIDSPRSSTTTWRRVTVTWEAPADVRELGHLFTLLFKVLPLPDADGSALTTIGWDAALVKDAANTVVKHKATAPTALLIKQDAEITLLAPIVIVEESSDGN